MFVFHLAQQPLGSTIFWQMTEFCFLFLVFFFLQNFFSFIFFKTESHSVVQAGPELAMILLLQLLHCWDYSTLPNFCLLEITNSIVHVYHIFLIYSSSDRRHWDWLCIFVIVNNATTMLISFFRRQTQRWNCRIIG